MKSDAENYGVPGALTLTRGPVPGKSWQPRRGWRSPSATCSTLMSRGKPGRPVFAFMTDSMRTPHPARDMMALARGTIVIFRHYDADDRESLGRYLRAIARRRRLVFLVAGDRRLAHRLKADGLHLPESMVRRRARFAPARDQWLVTAAAHNAVAARRARNAGVDMILLSPIFTTASHPNRRPMGLQRLATAVRELECEVLALGGIAPENFRRVLAAGGAGAAGISGIARLSHDPHGFRRKQ